MAVILSGVVKVAGAASMSACQLIFFFITC